jgi:dihydroneopterin aldolase
MVSYYDIAEQLEHIDVQIISLLADRAKISSDLEDSLDADMVAESVAFWVEEAGEKGLDEEIAEKICKLVLLSSKKSEEL